MFVLSSTRTLMFSRPQIRKEDWEFKGMTAAGSDGCWSSVPDIWQGSVFREQSRSIVGPRHSRDMMKGFLCVGLAHGECLHWPGTQSNVYHEIVATTLSFPSFVPSSEWPPILGQPRQSWSTARHGYHRALHHSEYSAVALASIIGIAPYLLGPWPLRKTPSGNLKLASRTATFNLQAHDTANNHTPPSTKALSLPPDLAPVPVLSRVVYKAPSRRGRPITKPQSQWSTKSCSGPASVRGHHPIFWTIADNP